MEGWVPEEDKVEYLGRLNKQGQSVIACVCSDANTVVVSRAEVVELITPEAEESPSPEGSP